MCAISHILHLMCASPIMPRVHAQSAQQAVVVSVRRETVNLFKLNICQAFILFLLQARLLGLWFCHPLASWVIICHHQAVFATYELRGPFQLPIAIQAHYFCRMYVILAHYFVTHSICWPTILSPIVNVFPLILLFMGYFGSLIYHQLS